MLMLVKKHLYRSGTAMRLQVPFKLRDEDIPDDWTCSDNVWDKDHASCSVPQALTDEEIDEILALQVPLHPPIAYAFCSLMSLFFAKGSLNVILCPLLCSKKPYMTLETHLQCQTVNSWQIRGM